MAKAAKASAPAGPLADQKIAFVGKFGYKDSRRADLVEWARDAGAVVVEATEELDVLVVGEGRGGNPPAEVAKVRKRVPGARELTMAELARDTLPSPAEFARWLKAGTERDYKFWDAFDHHARTAATRLDLNGVDLRGASLGGAKLEHVSLDGADLRGAKVRYTHFGILRGANFDRVDGPNVYLMDLNGCTFREAALEKAWMFWGMSKAVVGCDFGGAKMPHARAERATFTDCTFVGADWGDALVAGTAFTNCDFGGANLAAAQAHKARFAGTKFVGAKLSRADLREASLRGADLTNADLREAALGGADLTGAVVDGADFAGAVLAGGTLTNVDFSKAKNYVPPAARVPGPKAQELAQAAAGAKKFSTDAQVDLGPGEHATCHLRAGPGGPHASTRHYRDGHDTHNWITAPTLEQGLLNMADRWPNATLRLDTVTATGSPTVRGAKLQALAVAAWAEAFGVAAASPDDLAAQQAAQKTAALNTRDELLARIRQEGPGVWRSIDYRRRDRIDLRGADFSATNLSGIELRYRKDLGGATFTGANLASAELWGSDLSSANFVDANLSSANLQHSQLQNASFVNAKLCGANLQLCKLQGTDFTGADLADAKLDKAQFDEATKFPAGFVVPESALWKGDGSRPGSKPARAAVAGSLDFDVFLKALPTKVDPSRTEKAAAMLRSERFQLFADVSGTHLVGVVKSQSSKGLVYSCRLASDGTFCCGTQNLKPCGGLQGALCKHLLVLVIGLARAGKLDPAVADNWVAASKAHKPALDKDALADTFLKYKGAEAGELDWRPTETVPEDFYAM